MGHVIIVEGIDRVGKTTLVNMLREATGYDVFKDDARYFGFGYDNTEKTNTAMNFIEQVKPNIILDRFHVTEYVYGFIERNIENSNMIDIDKRLSEMDSLIILVKPTDIKWSSEKHGKDLTLYEKLFETFVSFSECEVIETDFNNLENAVKFVKEKIK